MSITYPPPTVIMAGFGRLERVFLHGSGEQKKKNADCVCRSSARRCLADLFCEGRRALRWRCAALFLRLLNFGISSPLPKPDVEKIEIADRMNNAMAQVHNDNHEKKMTSFQRFEAKEPRRSDTISAENCYVYRSALDFVAEAQRGHLRASGSQSVQDRACQLEASR